MKQSTSSKKIRANSKNKEMLLTISDRDGTLVEFVSYLGKDENWKDQTKLNLPVIKLLKYIFANYKNKLFVVTNQAGVARKHYDCKRVEEINKFIESKLAKHKIKIDGWNYCPDVDKNYVTKHLEIDFDNQFIKKQTSRKPAVNMVLELLSKRNLSLSSFQKVLVLGDSEDDRGLAENLNCNFINVKEKTYKQLKDEFLTAALRDSKKIYDEKDFSFRK